MIDKSDVIDNPGGIHIKVEKWPIKFTTTCPCSNTKFVGHVPLQLPYGTAIMFQESESRRMEVRVCAMCGSLYYHCDSKEKSKT